MTGARPAALASASAEAKRSMVPTLAMNSADSTAPIPGRERMRAPSGWRSSSASQVAVDAGDRLARLKSLGSELADHVGEDGLAGNDDALALWRLRAPVRRAPRCRAGEGSSSDAPRSGAMPARRISAGVT